MRVLVVEGTSGAGTSARSALIDAGHDVTSCHNGGATFPCHGLGGGPGCPLDDGSGVDVVMLVRDTPSPEPSAREDGVRCALRRHIPLALAGALDDNPYVEFAAASSTSLDDVVTIAEKAATSPMAAHMGVARTALRTVMETEGLDASSADVSVVRHGPALTVTMLPGTPLEPRVVETASVRVLAAVRALDRAASIIDVTVAQTPGVPR
jgi:hypothetical protein